MMTIRPTRDCFSTKGGIKVREKMGKQMRKKICTNLERVQELGTAPKGLQIHQFPTSWQPIKGQQALAERTAF